MIPVTDMQARALDRLAYQYEDSPILKAVMALFVGEFEEIRDAALTLEKLRRIDESEGDGLDLIGEILGQPRELSGVVPIDYFGYHDGEGGDPAEGYGDLNDPTAGLRFRSINESPTANKTVGDEEMRRLLDAQVYRSRTNATPEEIITSIQQVLPDDPPTPVQLTFGTTSVLATVQRVLSSEEILILNAKAGLRGESPVIPRATGVELTVAGL